MAGVTQLTQTKGPVLILGPAYAGKSELAMRALYPDRAAVVLGTGDLGEPSFMRRVEALKALRPPAWDSVEPVRDLPAALDAVIRRPGGTPQILIDSLSQWLASQCVEGAPYADEDELEGRLAQEVERTLKSISLNPTVRIVIVSAEAGAGPAPQRPLERLYRRAIGDANRRLAQVANTVVLVNAGIPQVIKC